MKQEQFTIKTKDGSCKAYLITPEGKGPWPGILFYMDAFGIRPAMQQMATHLAEQGYAVLLPDLFYRFGAYGPLDPKEVLKGDMRAICGPMMATTDNLKAAQDTGAFIDFLRTRSEVNTSKMGTIGFCMGGGMALTAAAFYPDVIKAAASFHGGNLATEQPTSPHLQFSKIKAEVLVAGADNDKSYPPEMAKKTEEALTQAHVKHKCEIFKDKAHGWMKPDMPVFDPAAAERGWKEAFEVFHRQLAHLNVDSSSRTLKT